MCREGRRSDVSGRLPVCLSGRLPAAQADPPGDLSRPRQVWSAPLCPGTRAPASPQRENTQLSCGRRALNARHPGAIHPKSSSTRTSSNAVGAQSPERETSGSVSTPEPRSRTSSSATASTTSPRSSGRHGGAGEPQLTAVMKGTAARLTRRTRSGDPATPCSLTIHGELRMLGFDVSMRTVSRYLPRRAEAVRSSPTECYLSP